MWAVNENSSGPAQGGHDGQAGESLAVANGRGVIVDGSAAIANGQAASEAAAPSGVVDDLCRLTICGPARSVELAVPVHVPLIDLLPALLGHLGENLADTGLDHEGWVLQRLGDPPLREELSVAALGLRDGDMVHLRPRSDQLPPLDFDDLIDGVAAGISGRPDRWRPEMSRRLLTGLLGGPLAVGLVLLAGHLSAMSDLLAAGLAAVILGLTAIASRAYADGPAAAVLGAATIAYAGLAGAELPLLSTASHAVLPAGLECPAGGGAGRRGRDCRGFGGRHDGERRASPRAGRPDDSGAADGCGGRGRHVRASRARGRGRCRGDTGHAGGLLGAGTVLPAGEDAPGPDPHHCR